MKTQIVYVLISSEDDYFLEELWASLYSLRQFHPDERVVVLTDSPTADRIRERPSLLSLITNLKIVTVPEDYNGRYRSRTIKTSIRNIINGDFLYIDTDTIICSPINEVDDLPIKNIGMVPEMHGAFKKHLTYNFITQELMRIYNTDVKDAPYWFNSGCMLVRDNSLTHEFFKKWNENWKNAALNKGASSDQRPLLKTDHDYGYIIECLPGVYNCQMALSIEYFHEAKIVHFWHMRSDFTTEMDFSPFYNGEISQQIRKERNISATTAKLIKECKSSFRTPSMLVGQDDINFLFSPLHTVLGKAYKESLCMHWFLKNLIYWVNLYYRIKNSNMKKILMKICPKLYATYGKMKYAIMFKFSKKRLISDFFQSFLGYKMDWKNPQDLNEKINWMKLYYNTTEWSNLADKYKVRKYIKERIGEKYLVKLYGVWGNAKELDFNALPSSFVIKTNNGAGTVLPVPDKTKLNIQEARKKINQWMKIKYGYHTIEPHYLSIKPLIIAEEYLINDSDFSSSLVDYKVYCFNGKPFCILVCSDRTIGKHAHFSYYDCNWNPLPHILCERLKGSHIDIKKPECLSELLDCAAKLSKGHPQVRVDFYIVKGKIYFGEMTFTSNGGYDSDITREFSLEMGTKIDLCNKN